MQITIAPALLSEAGELARIQKAAFKPLYERFRDDANPYLRGEEDIVRRLDRNSRFFTIRRDGEIVGGICYRLYGKRSPTATLADGEYELHNLSVLPEYRHRGFGRRLLDYAKSNVAARSGRIIKIGIIEESAVLKSWYIANGFVPTGAKKFEHLPFTSGYLEWTPPREV